MRYFGKSLPPPLVTEPARRGLAAPLLAIAVLAAAAGWAEWRHSAGLLAGVPSVAEAVQQGAASPDAAMRALDALAAAAAGAAAEARRSLLGRFGPAGAAHRRYLAAAEVLLPGPLGDAAAAALAAEGGSLELHDSLRALAILRGEAPWQPAFVAGWLAERGEAGLARHAGALSGPPAGLPAPDARLLKDARAIVAEGDAAAMAFLDLSRDARMQAVPGWSPAEVPDLASVLVRRSGRPVEEPIAGQFTAAGWAAASAGPARDAARGMEVEERAVLAELQRRTLAAWSAELADLRVKPFADQAEALRISRILARPGSPLEALARTLWHEVGGGDSGRGADDRLRIAAAFGPTAQFVEQGGMAEIARLFAGLEAALAPLDPEAEVGRRRLMDARARSASIAALERAPRPIAALVEDVLAQTTASQEGLLKPRAALVWQRDLAGACRFALDGRYPFAAGPDADLGLVAALIGPSGTLARFRAGELTRLMDTTGTPWRWTPEARLSGLLPESAAFLERAAAAGAALFPPDGVALTVAALDEREAATASLGGVVVPVAGSDEPLALAWPGPQPAEGLGIAIATGTGVERKAWPGAWGLLHFLDELTVRALDGGQRYLLDVRLDETRAGLELTFAHPANPAAARGLIAGLACPAAL